MVHLRVNTSDGGTRFVTSTYSDWTFPAEDAELAVDAAAAVWPLGQANYDFKFVAAEQCATDEVIAREAINVGDDLFLTGLFVNHYGTQRNLPIVRVGNIAAMPAEPVATKLGSMQAYLVESRSVGGLSGSPVFVSMAGLERYDASGSIRPRSGPAWYLLGLVHGHFQSPVVDGGGADAAGGMASEYVNQGIAIVTPISKVLDLFPTIRERVTSLGGPIHTRAAAGPAGEVTT